MSDSRDPVEARAEDGSDLYEVSTWEVRTLFDRVAAGLYATGVSAARLFVVILAFAILVVQFALGGLGAITDPIIGAFTLLSAVPALALAAYVWYADVTTSEPLELLVGTFVLGVLFAGFAGILNSIANGGLEALGLTAGVVGFVFQVLFFFLVVGPVEETVKLLAARPSRRTLRRRRRRRTAASGRRRAGLRVVSPSLRPDRPRGRKRAPERRTRRRPQSVRAPRVRRWRWS